MIGDCCEVQRAVNLNFSLALTGQVVRLNGNLFTASKPIGVCRTVAGILRVGVE
jgi:hypothetical protein